MSLLSTKEAIAGCGGGAIEWPNLFSRTCFKPREVATQSSVLRCAVKRRQARWGKASGLIGDAATGPGLAATRVSVCPLLAYGNFQQCFSHCSVCTAHLESFRQSSDSEKVRLSLIICISNTLPGNDVNTAGPQTSL